MTRLATGRRWMTAAIKWYAVLAAIKLVTFTAVSIPIMGNAWTDVPHLAVAVTVLIALNPWDAMAFTAFAAVATGVVWFFAQPGGKFFAAAVLDEMYTWIRHPYRRHELTCPGCGRVARARSHNMVLLKDSIHSALSNDHPTYAEDVPEDWPDAEPQRVEG